MTNKKKIILVFTLLISLFTLTGCSTDTTQNLNNFTDETNILGWIFVYPIGTIMSFVGNLFSSSYGIAIIVTTIFVRFMAWPIYAGQSNMGFNLQQAQPELDKLNAKYAGRDDRESQMQKQMEAQAIMKKHNVSFKSCLAMPIQMCLFIGMTNAMIRIAVEGGKLSLSNFDFLGFDLRGSAFSTEYGGVSTLLFSIVLALIVTVTMAGQIYYSKKTAPKPTNPKPKTPEQLKTEKMMNMFMLAQPVILGFMAAGNTAYGLYWTVGNLCSFLTILINKKIQNEKRKMNESNLKSSNNDIIDI